MGLFWRRMTPGVAAAPVVEPMREPSFGSALAVWWCQPRVASTSRCLSKKPAVYLSERLVLSELSFTPAICSGWNVGVLVLADVPVTDTARFWFGLMSRVSLAM